MAPTFTDTLNSQADYIAALKEGAGLMDAAPGSQEEIKLEQIVATIEAYEETHFPTAMQATQIQTEQLF